MMEDATPAIAPVADWEKVCELVELALDLPSAERAGFLARASVSEAVRAEAASLVAAADSKGAARLLEADPQALAPLIAEASAEAGPLASLWVGRRLGPYVVLRELGHGGMGLVLLAKRADELYERTVAIKVIQTALAQDDFTRRFRRETRILARLQHPAIVTLLDAGITEDQQPFLVMEYVDGMPLSVYVERENLDLQQLLGLVITLCDALAHAHAHGVVHRDVKPGNVLVSSTGELKLLDFGIARLAAGEGSAPEQTLTSFRAVTPTYASPEQIAGMEGTPRSDIYSVAVLLYVLLTGTPPFQLTGLSTAEIERVLRTAQPTLPSRAARGRFAAADTAALDAVIGRAMHPDPERRFASMADLGAELARVQAKGRPETSARHYLATRWWQRHRVRVVRGSAVAAALLVAAGIFGIGRRERRAVLSPATAPARLSIAVVPLVETQPEARWASLAAGEALAAELGSGDQIRVAPSSAVAAATRDLHLAAGKTLTADQMARLGTALETDYVLQEHAEPTGTPGAFHLSAALFRANGGQRVVEQTVEASNADLPAKTSELAVKMAQMMPLHRAFALSPSLLPRDPAAVRAYAEGLAHLEQLEPMPAREEFERAKRIEPGSPLVHAELARTLEMLGYHGEAAKEAGQARSLAGGLPVRTRLVVEAQAHEIERAWPAAIASYKTLRDYDPDNVDYVLGLARAQLAANAGADALQTLSSAKTMPGLLGSDPRLTLLTSNVEEELGKHADALRDADTVLAAARERQATQLMAQAQRARSDALESLGQVDEGLRAAQQARTLFASAGDRRGEGSTLTATGNFLEDHAEYARARGAFNAARDIFVALGDEGNQAIAEVDLGVVAGDLTSPEEAIAHYRTALAIFKRTGDLPRTAQVLNNIGLEQKAKGDLQGAEASFTQGLRLLQQSGDNRHAAQQYDNLGFLLAGQGKLDEAARDFQQAYAIYSGEGEALKSLIPMQGMGRVAWDRGRLTEAHGHYTDTINLARKLGHPQSAASALRVDAHVLHDMGDEEDASRELTEAAALRESHGDAVSAAQTRVSALTFELDNGKPVEDARFAQFLDFFTTHKLTDDEADVHLAWARSLLLQKRLPEAAAHLHHPVVTKRLTQDKSYASDVLPVQAQLLAQQGQVAKALQMLTAALSKARAEGGLLAEIGLKEATAEVLATERTGRSSRKIAEYAREARAAGFLRVANHMEALQSGVATRC